VERTPPTGKHGILGRHEAVDVGKIGRRAADVVLLHAHDSAIDRGEPAVGIARGEDELGFRVGAHDILEEEGRDVGDGLLCGWAGRPAARLVDGWHLGLDSLQLLTTSLSIDPLQLLTDNTL
jgi:hypothetical protein